EEEKKKKFLAAWEKLESKNEESYLFLNLLKSCFNKLS
ncbi:MAG: hypothetical protein RLZZ143_3010, partial [Cyanobacteriota bacterium]